MKDFVNWCVNKDLVTIFDDGTVAWNEATDKGKSTKHSEKFAGGRDIRKDLSDDYKDYCHHMGTVWPFKLVGKGKGGKAVAPVAK
jgi:hypothetical protein